MKGKYDREFVARQDEDQTIFVAGQVTERPRAVSQSPQQTRPLE